jgi:hypothetical protein
VLSATVGADHEAWAGQEDLSEDSLDAMTLPVLDVEFLFAVTATPSDFYDCGGLGRNEFRLNGTYERLGLSQAETDIARLQFLGGPTDDQHAVGS